MFIIYSQQTLSFFLLKESVFSEYYSKMQCYLYNLWDLWAACTANLYRRWSPIENPPFGLRVWKLKLKLRVKFGTWFVRESNSKNGTKLSHKNWDYLLYQMELFKLAVVSIIFVRISWNLTVSLHVCFISSCSSSETIRWNFNSQWTS